MIKRVAKIAGMFKRYRDAVLMSHTMNQETGTDSVFPNEGMKNSFMDPIVKGANLWQHFNVRCPSCNKLFRIDAREIHSSEPRFECTGCKALFAFQYPPASVNKVETWTVELPKMEALQAAPSESVKDCPKCGAKNPLLGTECQHCQVVFAKVTELDGDIQNRPLANAWRELMADYDNLKKHVAFVDRCEELHALPFALKKYEALREAQPHDPVAVRMYQQAIRNLEKNSPRYRAFSKQAKQLASKVNWSRLFRVAPLAIASSLIFMGLLSPSMRNLVGFGAALLFLTVGLRIFIKGRIDIRDFY